MVRGLVSFVLDELKYIIQQERILAKGSEEELEKLSSSFPTIHAAIHEAEAKSLSLKLMDSGSKEWKEMKEGFLKLKDLACDIEDLLDRQSIEALTSHNEHDSDPIGGGGTGALHLQSQLDEQGNTEWVSRVRGKVRNFLPNCLRLFGLKKVLLKLEIMPLRSRMEEINSWKDRTNFSVDRTCIDTPESSSSEINEEIPCRKEDIKSIKKLLLKEEGEEEDSQRALPVISIIGPGGIGKTTLAQQIRYDYTIRRHFEPILWVSVSDRDFDVGRIAKSIVENIAPSPMFNDSSDPLQLLQKTVRGMKFLLFLDDVWTVDTDMWSRLKDSLQTGSGGSRIVVTTQRERVSRALSSSNPYYLQPLDMDYCWSLFKSIAFFKRSKEECSMLNNTKRKIVKRSGGLPLFTKAWGGILLLEDTREGWESISECEVWDAAKSGVWQHYPELNVWKDVLRTLERIYVLLPSHLKRCFKYCSLFPKGCWIDKQVLTQLWMAEGFIQLEDGIAKERNMEEIGAEYFDDLLSETCFFKDIERDDNGNIVRCKMQEPLHDVVGYFSDEFSLIKDGRFNKLPSISSTQHSSLHCVENVMSISSSLYKANKVNKVRTLLCFGNPGYLKLQGDFSSCLKFLRVLDLSLTNIKELSHSVGTLKHLRYLNLAYTPIKKLPAFICNLNLLQTLKLSHSLLLELPKETWKLKKLRHLEIDGTPMNHLPSGMERLSNIRKLSEFIVGVESGYCSIGELGNLNLLQGRLIISNLDRILGEDDAAKANLNKKDYIDCLILDGKKHFSSQNLDCKRRCSSLLLEHMYKRAVESKIYNESETRVESVFEGINPHVNLRRLEIWNYIGLKFPKWMENRSLENLISLKLVKCLKVKHFPHLGDLPSLKYLHVCEMFEVEHIAYCDTKGFPKLERLVLERMLGLKVWESEVKGVMPCFVELQLSNCPNLSELLGLPMTLRKLEIYKCQAICHIHPLPPVKHLMLKGSDNILHLLLNIPQLISLKITLSPELASLPSGLIQLKGLRTLSIHFCPKLGSLPQELQHLTTLKEIHIVGCPLLTTWYEKEKSKDWSAGKLSISIDSTDYMDSKGFDNGDDNNDDN